MSRLSGYELLEWRVPRPGDLYLEPRLGVKLWTALDHYSALGAERRRHIVKRKEEKATVALQPIKLSPVVSFDAAAAEPTPVLVAEFFDAAGNSSTNTFYDADLAARFYNRT